VQKTGKHLSKINWGSTDLACPNWTSVYAVASGTVTVAEWNNPTKEGLRSYGLWVEIDHDGGVRTRYAHLCELKVYVGQKVLVGDVIGKSGNTGDVLSGGKSLEELYAPPEEYPVCSNEPQFQAGAHVHFEFLLDDTAHIDPEVFCIPTISC
jgi:murein DD-endopeptidase MepM/ murein hydrolase activator NlpD